MTQCPSCGATSAEGSAFCASCGTSLAAMRPNEGTPPLQAPPPHSPAPPLQPAQQLPKKRGGCLKWVGIALLLLVAVIIIASVASGGGDGTTTTGATATTVADTTQTTDSANAQDTTSITEPPSTTTEPEDVGFGPGMYKVGADISAGEYVLIAEAGSSYFQITKDSSGTLESIVANDNFSNQSIVTVKDGQYITSNDARLIPSAQAVPAVLVEGRLPAGMYKVGFDLPPGEYKVIPDGSGYLEVDSNSSHTLEAIVSNENFDTERYVTVKEGQYLKLSRASVVVN